MLEVERFDVVDSPEGKSLTVELFQYFLPVCPESFEAFEELEDFFSAPPRTQIEVVCLWIVHTHFFLVGWAWMVGVGVPVRMFGSELLIECT